MQKLILTKKDGKQTNNNLTQNTNGENLQTKNTDFDKKTFEEMFDEFFEPKENLTHYKGQEIETDNSNSSETINISEVINSLRQKYAMKSVYFNGTDEKSNKKINAAVKAYGEYSENGDQVLACQDEMLLGGGNEGFIFTTKAIFIKTDDKKFYFNYNNIYEVENSGSDLIINGQKYPIIMVDKDSRSVFC